MGAWVYVLRCSDGSYYTGTTRGELGHRIDEHRSGAFHGYTFSRRPVVLVYSQHFERIVDAISAERQINGWSKAKKKALVDGDYERLKVLSKRR